MSILCTMPGRSGDILWSLSTVRAIAETYGEPVDLCISGKYGSLKGLIERQDYIRCVTALPAWALIESAPITPRQPPFFAEEGYSQIFHLGYDGWPHPDLARDIHARAYSAVFRCGMCLAPLDLDRPWLIAPYALPPQDITVGFTDEHFELKYGLYDLLLNRFCFATSIQQHQAEVRQVRASGFHDWSSAADMVKTAPAIGLVESPRKSVVWVGNSPRWLNEADRSAVDWETAASWIAASQVFVGCCSALHVLAIGLGRKVVCVEPNPHRQAEVFWPVGKAGQVKLVLGGDGLPTNDARHLGDAVEESLRA